MRFLPPAPYPVRASVVRRIARDRRRLERENAVLRARRRTLGHHGRSSRAARRARWKRAMVRLFGYAPSEQEIREEAERVLELYGGQA